MTQSREQEYITLIEQMKAKIVEMNEFIEKISKQSAPYATVAYVSGDRVILCAGNSLVECEAPSDIEVKCGDTVKVVQQTGQISMAGIVQDMGSFATVSEVVNEHSVRIAVDGSSRVAFKDPGLALESGDTVVLDPSNRVVVAKSGSAAKKFVRSNTGVRWSDIGGLDEVKRQMIEIVELPLREPEIFKHYGYTPPKGVLLSGPPGCGKTMVGKAVATAIAEAHGAESGFIYVKGPEVLNKFVGESESTVRSIFDQARDHQRRTGAPAVIFIDEAESLLSKRGSGGTVSNMEKTIVPTFLAEMDGIEPSGAVVILATNRPEQLDSAIVRDGRVDRKIEITRPDATSVQQIAMINLTGVPVDGSTPEQLSVEIVREIMNPARVVASVNTQRGVVDVKLSDIVSGALVANVVERAKSTALSRDLAAKTRTGVTSADVANAISTIQAESKNIDHSEPVYEILKAGVSRVSAAA